MTQKYSLAGFNMDLGADKSRLAPAGDKNCCIHCALPLPEGRTRFCLDSCVGEWKRERERNRYGHRHQFACVECGHAGASRKLVCVWVLICLFGLLSVLMPRSDARFHIEPFLRHAGYRLASSRIQNAVNYAAFVRASSRTIVDDAAREIVVAFMEVGRAIPFGYETEYLRCSLENRDRNSSKSVGVWPDVGRHRLDVVAHILSIFRPSASLGLSPKPCAGLKYKMGLTCQDSGRLSVIPDGQIKRRYRGSIDELQVTVNSYPRTSLGFQGLMCKFIGLRSNHHLFIDGNTGATSYEDSETTQDNSHYLKTRKWFAFPLFLICVGSGGVFFGGFFGYIHRHNWYLIVGLLSLGLGLVVYIWGLSLVLDHSLFTVPQEYILTTPNYRGTVIAIRNTRMANAETRYG
jgi:hypothetical protein